jgi:hypothetical protein
MGYYDEKRPNQSNCCLAVAVSLIFGAVIGVLFAFDLVANMVVAAWIVFGIGVLAFVLLFAGVFTSSVTMGGLLPKCLRRNIGYLLAGIIGTIISAIVLLAIEIVATDLIAAFVAITAFFFAFMIAEFIIFINSLVYESRYPHEG